jgi:transcriptional regulator with XRE-family HTH domain
MSEKTGIPLRTYLRLENGEMENPPITYLVNCAIVLNMPLEDICEAAWLAWSPFDPRIKPRRSRVQVSRPPGTRQRI